MRAVLGGLVVPAKTKLPLGLTGVCFDFQNGDCTRKNGRYSHDANTVNNGAQRRVRAEETTVEVQEISRDTWLSSIYTGHTPPFI